MMPARKSRRGSTLVMVAILLVAFVGVGAIAADIGRYYVVTGELQTAADAAALAGGLALQRTQVLNPATEVQDSVIAFVTSTNGADGKALSVTRDSIRMAYYTPGPPATITFDVTGKRPNAVVVGLIGAPKGVFASLLGRTGSVGLSRQASVWVANLSINCVRPWAFPYHVLYDVVMGTTGSALVGAPNLDPVKFAQFENLSNSQRMFILTGPNNPTGAPVHDGNWEGYSFAGNAGKPGYQGEISGCANPTKQTAVNVLGGTTLPGASGNNYVNWTTAAIEPSPPNPGTCYMQPKAANDAGCYQDAAAAAAGKPGVVINVAWGDMNPKGGSGAFNAREVGEFVLTCYYRGNANESCPLQKPGAPAIGYPEGTLVGYVNTLRSKNISPATILNNSPSNLQRLILVR